MDTSIFYYPFLCLIFLLQNFPDHGLGITVPDEGNQTVQIEVGDDTFFPCSAKPRYQLYDWKKGENPVQADDAYRSKRLFIIPREGLLLLNVEETDAGVFICQVFNRDGSFIEIFITLEVLRKEEEEDEDEFKCGIPRLRGGRIISGSEVKRAGSYPWMALLMYESSPGVTSPFCGGTLLSRSYVVTAAHCFRQYGYTANNVVVRLGEYIISQTETYEKTVRIAEIRVHPDYIRATFESDIALIRLAEPVTYSNYILPLCIPSELRGEQLLASPSYGIVTGWGKEELRDGSPLYSDELNKARLHIIDQAECAESHVHAITNVMFCALGGSERSGVRDACQGDSGGPFLMREDDRSYLVGIISWGIGCANAEIPGVYTRVPRFRSWILEIINAAPETCTETVYRTEEDLGQDQDMIKELESRVKDLETQLGSQEPAVCTTAPPVPTTSGPEPTTAKADIRTPCIDGSCFRMGGYRLWAQCVDDVCECHSPFYSKYTCLPTIGSCIIYQDVPFPAGIPLSSRQSTTYSCIGDQGSEFDVHVLAVYEGNVHTIPPTAGTMPVTIMSTLTQTKPVILVFSNYEPVNWILDVSSSLNIEKVILISHHADISSVTLAPGNSQTLDVEKMSRVSPRGYGTDSGGGNTAGMLNRLTQEYGTVTSFTGIYQADGWSWSLVEGQVPSTVTEASRRGEGVPEGDAVVVSEDAWSAYQFRYDNNWNSCNGARYVRRRPVASGSSGQYVGAVLCTNDRYKLYLANDLNSEFKNIADTSGHGADHCEFAGAQQDSEITIDSNFWYSPSAQGYYRRFWGDDILEGPIGGGMGAGWTGRYYSKWYECGVSIP